MGTTNQKHFYCENKDIIKGFKSPIYNKRIVLLQEIDTIHHFICHDVWVNVATCSRESLRAACTSLCGIARYYVTEWLQKWLHPCHYVESQVMTYMVHVLRNFVQIRLIASNILTLASFYSIPTFALSYLLYKYEPYITILIVSFLSLVSIFYYSLSAIQYDLFPLVLLVNLPGALSQGPCKCLGNLSSISQNVSQ